jgi:HemY protein
MIRLLAFLAVVFLLGLGFAWLADRPGDMVVTLDGYQYQVSLMAAAALLTALVAAVMVLWWLVKSIWTSPTPSPGILRGGATVAIKRCQPA